jgi:isochorismate hydrolase
MDQDTDDAARINGPAPGGVGLLIIDMINDLAYRGSEPLVASAKTIVGTVLELRNQADRLKIPVVYVNDNFGQWRSERARLVDHAGAQERRLATSSSRLDLAKPA